MTVFRLAINDAPEFGDRAVDDSDISGCINGYGCTPGAVVSIDVPHDGMVVTVKANGMPCLSISSDLEPVNDLVGFLEKEERSIR